MSVDGDSSQPSFSEAQMRWLSQFLPKENPTTSHQATGPLYAYTSHLTQLQNFMLLLGPQIPGPLLGGSSPLRTEAFKAALKHHPDRQHRDYIIIGLAEGFRVGEHDSVVSAYIDAELSANRLLGSLPSHVARYTHYSRIGVVPKGHNTGKWRLITDLFFPEGFSVNDGISPAFCSLSYISVDAVAVVIASLEQGTLLAEIDIQAAYRLIPVQPLK
eukprot:Em0007g1136a